MVVTENLEVQIRSLVEEDIGECTLVENNCKRPVADGAGRTQVIVQAQILVPRLDAHAADTISKLIDHATPDFVTHRDFSSVSLCRWYLERLFVDQLFGVEYTFI